MASVNKAILIGRLTREPEAKSFASGAKVVKFALAINNKKKDKVSGKYVDDVMFIECEVFNRGEGKLADIAEQYMRKGSLVFVEGKLAMDQWEDKNDGSKRSKIKVVVDNFQLLTPKAEAGGGGGRAPVPGSARRNEDIGDVFGSSNEDGPQYDDNIPF